MESREENYLDRAQRLVNELSEENGLDDVMKILIAHPVVGRQVQPIPRQLATELAPVKGEKNRFAFFARKVVDVALTGFALTVPGYAPVDDRDRSTP